MKNMIMLESVKISNFFFFSSESKSFRSEFEKYEFIVYNVI